VCELAYPRNEENLPLARVEENLGRDLRARNKLVVDGELGDDIVGRGPLLLDRNAFSLQTTCNGSPAWENFVSREPSTPFAVLTPSTLKL
jgi:hypothetical protein